MPPKRNHQQKMQGPVTSVPKCNGLCVVPLVFVTCLSGHLTLSICSIQSLLINPLSLIVSLIKCSSTATCPRGEY